ncbi:MAG: WD40/YVTN/BNR-like repeat-containing protein [Gammaproteobacteria bacterium]
MNIINKSVGRGARALLGAAFGLSLGLGLVGTVAAESAASSQLAVVRQGIPHDALYAMVINGKDGLAVGAAGKLLETKDGGASWTEGSSGTEFGLFGIAVKGEHKIIVGQRGTVLVGGADGKWTPGQSNTENRLLNVGVNSSGLAIAVGEFGTILRSRDGGKTWEQRPVDWTSFRDDGYEPHIYSVDVQENGRILIGAEFAYVITSDDGGETFQLANKGEKSIFAMHVLPDGTAYAVGQEGLAMKSTDNGATWAELNTNSNANLFGVWASSQGEVVATGMRALLRSSDGGQSFTASTDLDVVRNWYVPVAMGQAEFKGDGGAMVQEVVYIAGYQGTIARVLH